MVLSTTCAFITNNAQWISMTSDIIPIHSFEAKIQKHRTLTERLADEINRNAGSFGFFLANVILFAGWILVNTGKVSGVAVFDPFPFQLLTTIVSLEAIFLAIFVLMSQNRQSTIDSLREELHLQINEIAEREITKALRLIAEIHEKVTGEKRLDPELERMYKSIDTSRIEKKLEAELEPQPLVIRELLEKLEEKLRMRKAR